MSCCRSHQAKTKEKLQQQHVQSDFGAVVVVVVAMLLQQIAAASFVVDQDECFWNLLDPLPAASCTRISAPRYISAASVPSPSPFPSLPFPSLRVAGAHTCENSKGNTKPYRGNRKGAICCVSRTIKSKKKIFRRLFRHYFIRLLPNLQKSAFFKCILPILPYF